MNTVSLEVAKELYELGWRKETLFEYDNGGGSNSKYHTNPTLVSPMKSSYIRSLPVLKAPQLHEILEVLPYMISIGTKNVFFKMEIFEDNYYIGYYKCDGGYTFEEKIEEQINENPHDAAALLWIWCVENGYISLPNNDT